MASGLAALLDDVAAIAKLAAASLDDTAAAAGKASSKAIGVVVDDAAVTPGYAMGFTPDRELPIVWKIAVGSLRNKFLFLLPAALLLSAFAPWAVTPILMIGGAYLCFEATEKVLESLHPHGAHDNEAELALSSTELERAKVRGAIRTDLILSAEIMAISLGAVASRPLAIQAGALAAVSLLLTIAVYGVVGLIVKMDDVGLHLAKRSNPAARRLGTMMVQAMPRLLGALSVVGTAAMLWVGGGIVLHGLEQLHVLPQLERLHELGHALAPTAALAGFLSWMIFAAASAVFGLVLGAVVAVLVAVGKRLKKTPAR